MDVIKKLGLGVNITDNKIVCKEFEFQYGNQNSTDELQMEDDKLDVLMITEADKMDKDDVKLANEVANRSDLTGDYVKQLVNLLLFNLTAIVAKPKFIKDYLFSNELVSKVIQRIIKPYPIPLKMLSDAKAKMKNMVADGILSKVNSVIHTHPAFFAVKPNKTLRLLINAVYKGI